MEIQITPPAVEEIVKALRPILTTGVPVRPEFDNFVLLGLRGVVARSIDPVDRLSRVKALDGVIKNQLVYYPDDELG